MKITMPSNIHQVDGYYLNKIYKASESMEICNCLI